MLDRISLPADPVSVAAFVFGAAVVIPSMTALVLTLLAVADALF